MSHRKNVPNTKKTLSGHFWVLEDKMANEKPYIVWDQNEVSSGIGMVCEAHKKNGVIGFEPTASWSQTIKGDHNDFKLKYLWFIFRVQADCELVV
jgi:hypothetical protein